MIIGFPSHVLKLILGFSPRGWEYYSRPLTCQVCTSWLFKLILMCGIISSLLRPLFFPLLEFSPWYPNQSFWKVFGFL